MLNENGECFDCEEDAAEKRKHNKKDRRRDSELNPNPIVWESNSCYIDSALVLLFLGIPELADTMLKMSPPN
jgi:hypothetical protein